MAEATVTGTEAAPVASWRRCSSCKKPLGFEAGYWVCNVSTCNRPRTGLVFCTVSCWDAHLSVVNHRESWAVEKRSPSRAEWAREQAAEAAPKAAAGATTSGPQPRRILPKPAAGAPETKRPREVLVVASKLKEYVRLRAGFNTSDRALEALSDVVRVHCDRAIEKARAEGRRTVLERDFE